MGGAAHAQATLPTWRCRSASPDRQRPPHLPCPSNSTQRECNSSKLWIYATNRPPNTKGATAVDLRATTVNAFNGVEALIPNASFTHVLRDPAPEVFFDEFGDHALKVVLVYWVEFENPMPPRRVDSDLRHNIYGRLAASGVSIPIPQRVVQINFAQPACATSPIWSRCVPDRPEESCGRSSSGI
jgi:hypothetical protein